VKRLLALVAGGLGLNAFWQRRARPALSPSPADDLRAKLAAARTVGDEPAEAGPAETPVEPGEDVAARRADVHERARRALDELK
jgi:hypothetical protein